MPMRFPAARIAIPLLCASLLTLAAVVANAALPASTSRSCLTAAARGLLQRIETQFGTVHVVSTCRPGATIAGTGRPSRHASGNAVDFTAGSRKDAIVKWLIANHRGGGTMTYAGLDHIHVDIGRHFVALSSGSRGSSPNRAWPKTRMSLGAGAREKAGN